MFFIKSSKFTSNFLSGTLGVDLTHFLTSNYVAYFLNFTHAFSVRFCGVWIGAQIRNVGDLLLFFLLEMILCPALSSRNDHILLKVSL